MDQNTAFNIVTIIEKMITDPARREHWMDKLFSQLLTIGENK
jgi:hypothetical protein